MISLIVVMVRIIFLQYVSKVRPEVEKHPHSYKIGWIKKISETNVTETCLMKFLSDKYILMKFYVT